MSFVRSRYGEFKIIDTDSVISKSLKMYGEWAQNEIDLLEYFIHPGAVVVDAGAFIGTHTRAFSALVGLSGKVISFEPRHEIYSVLIENAALAAVDNIRPINMGLSVFELTITAPLLHLAEQSNFGAVNLESKEGQTGVGEVIKLTALDSLALDRLDFLKIDVEGMEFAVLNGAKETVKQCRPVIFAECNSLEAGIPIIKWAQVENYQSYGVLSAAYNQFNFAGNVENIFGAAREVGLLLVPTEKYIRHEAVLSGQQLPRIRTADDLALLLLHKPQYPYEILASTAVSKCFSLLYPSPQADAYRQTLVERDRRIANRTQAVIERDRQIANLNQVMIEREAQIARLNHAVTERDGQIANLNQAMIERETQIARLNHAVTERDGQIANLNQAMIEREAQVRMLVSSKSWVITKPVRWIGRVVRGDFVAAMDPIKKALKSCSPNKLSLLTSNDDKLMLASSFVTPLPIEPTHPVAVILPIYRVIEMTKRCILAAMPGVLAVPDARIVIINDASPDVGMQEMLEQLAAQWPNIIVLLKNEKNLGFIGTVNRGLAYFPKHDVVLLNSDVIVPQDWLHRLIEEAYSRADIGTVTPFSNNATICSFPHFLQENNQPFNLDVDSIDIAFRHAKLPCIQAPTGVGFCMYIRRACLDVTGYLNQEKFGRGYGEENDLCQRALKSGWHNVISPNLYAYHEGGVSFSSDKQALVDRAMQVIDELHPGYHASVQSFIAQDPLKFARVERHIRLLAITTVPKILHISHAIGGGVGQHIEELAQHFSLQAAHIILAPYGEDGAVTISLGVGSHTDKLTFQVPNEYGVMVDLLKAIGVSAVHIHHTAKLKAEILDLPHDLGVAHLLTVHDYYWMNGNPTLTDKNGQYPGRYSDTLRNPLYPLPQGVTPESWQAQFRSLIEGASCVVFPSNAAKAIFNHVYETPNAVVAPHIEAQLNTSRKPTFVTKKDTYSIGILGAIGREKGADLLEQVAEASKKLNLPLEFKLIGYAYKSLRAIRTTGPYKTKDLPDLIQKHGLDVVFFPAQCPETYSYTLSYALDAGLPIIAPNIGAFPERLSGRANTLLFNHLIPAGELLHQITEFIDALSAGLSISAPIFEGDRPRSDFYVYDYLLIASRNLRAIEADKITMLELDFRQIISGSKDRVTLWRNVLTRALWSLYMNPAMRWVNHLIPYSMRRFIKRSLTRSPIHDVFNRET